MQGDERAPTAGRFDTTRWSLVADATGPASSAARAALEELCEAYWYPMYAYLRRRGRTPDDAQDLVQGFFATLLEKDWLSQADRARGRFRAWLLTALKHFVSNEGQKARAQKRGGGRLFHSLDFDAGERRYGGEATTEATAESIYERSFALALLIRVLADVEQRYRAQGVEKAERYETLRPYLLLEEAPSYRETGKVLGLSETAVKVAVHRLRARFREALRREIAETLIDPAEVDAEIRYLLQTLRPTR